MTPFPDIAFINEEATVCINVEATGVINEAAIAASVAPLINRPESSSEFAILIISSRSSFEMKKVNPSPALTCPSHLIFTSN